MKTVSVLASVPFIMLAASGVNECVTANAGCQQKCVDTYDSYFCSCNSGYKIVNTQFDCPGL